MQTTLNTYLAMGNDIVQYIQIGFLVYYSVIIGLVGLMILGALLYAICNVRCWKWLDGVGWWFLFLFMIIGFLFATILIALCVVFSDLCQAITITNLVPLLSSLIGTDYSDLLTTCTTGDGNII